MSQNRDSHHTGHATVELLHGSNFWSRFKKNIVIETKNAFGSLKTGAIFFSIILIGFYFFLLTFNEIKERWDIVFPLAVVYLVGTYLTLLPMYLVVPLAAAILFVPK